MMPIFACLLLRLLPCIWARSRSFLWHDSPGVLPIGELGWIWALSFDAVVGLQCTDLTRWTRVIVLSLSWMCSFPVPSQASSDVWMVPAALTRYYCDLTEILLCRAVHPRVLPSWVDFYTQQKRPPAEIQLHEHMCYTITSTKILCTSYPTCLMVDPLLLSSQDVRCQ